MRRQHLIWIAMVGVALGLGLGMQTAQAHPDEGCSLCHTPHNGAGDNSSVPLWNPEHTTTTLTDYYQGSATLDATLSAPDGASKLCLSCHDGTYDGMGALHTFGNGVPAVNGMGSLKNSHPVSFTYDLTLANTDGHLKDPATLDRDVLDKNGKMHCTSCHQVHKHASRQESSNLRWAYTGSNTVINGVTYGPTYLFCTHCHAK